MKKVAVIILLFVVIAGAGVGVSWLIGKSGGAKLTAVHGAVGGGKENLLRDEQFNEVLGNKHKLRQDNRDWSNGRLIKDALTYTDDNGREQMVDFAFFSDERFYEYYKNPPGPDEVAREKIVNSGIVLSTPIVLYSWDEVCDAFIRQSIVTEKDGVYYITDMEKLIGYIEEGKTWADIGMPDIYGKINITSPDPVKSSPGTTYYGLLASIMNGGYVDGQNLADVLPQLKIFYEYSGFMNNTPSDIFDLYLRTGMGAKPLVVDYEKSIIDFAYHNVEGYNQVKDRIRILYPQPTIWNSHCLVAFTEAGSAYVDAFDDKDIQDIAWLRYGFRTASTAGSYDSGNMIVEGIARDITSVVSGLKKEIYDAIIAELSQ